MSPGARASVFASSLNAPLGITLMIGSGMFVTINDALVKLVTQDLPVGQILCLRGLFALIGMMLVFRQFGSFAVMVRVHDLWGMALRVGAVVISNFMFVTGVKYLPLPDVVAIGFSSTLFMTVLAIPFLDERVGWRRGLATTVGFAGVLLMVRPTGDLFYWATLLPVANALAGAVRDLVTRRISLTESSIAMLFYATLAVAVSGLATLPAGGWAWPTWQQLGLLAVAASGLAISQYMVIEAFRWTEATLVAPFKYTTLAWALLAGFLFWGYLPDMPLIAGFALIVGSGLYIWRREGRGP